MDSFLSDLVLVEMLGLQSCCSPQNVTCDHPSPETAQPCPATSTGCPPKAAARVSHGTSDEFWSLPSCGLSELRSGRHLEPADKHRSAATGVVRVPHGVSWQGMQGVMLLSNCSRHRGSTGLSVMLSPACGGGCCKIQP